MIEEEKIEQDAVDSSGFRDLPGITRSNRRRMSYEFLQENKCPICKSPMEIVGLANDDTPLHKCTKCIFRISKRSIDAHFEKKNKS